MLITFILLLLFCSQIWLLSYYYPKQISHRMNYVLTNFSAHEYPKLYPISLEKIQLIRDVFLWLNYFNIVIGLALIIYFGFVPTNYRDNLNVLDDIPLLYGMIQFIPFICLELAGYKHLSLIRKLYQQRSRTAELQPRRLTNYIAKPYLIIAAIIYSLYILFELVLSNFMLTENLLIKITTVTLVNSLFIALTLMNLHGKKRDPFQSEIDRFKQTKFSIRTLVFISIFMTIYLMLHSWVNTYDHNYTEIIINTLYFQIIGLFILTVSLKNFKVEDINFNVYKKDHQTA